MKKLVILISILFAFFVSNAQCIDPPTLTLSSNAGEVCGTNAGTISGNTFGGSATEVNLSHDGSGTLDATTFTSSPFDFTYTPDAADAGNDVIITITTDNPEGAPCVPAEETYTLTVYPVPNVVAGSNSPVCAGEDILLTESGGDAVAWSWTGPGGFTSLNQNPTTTAANGTYTVEITDANGCTNTDNVVVTVNAAPPTPTVNTDCSGGADNGIITVTSPTGAEYEYTIDGTYQASTSFGPLADGSYNVTVMNTTTGCINEGSVIDLDCSGCANPPTLTLSSNASEVCGTNAGTISGNTFGGSATEVNLYHDGYGTLNANNFTTSPFDFTYTPDAADAGNDVIITITTDNPEGAPCVPAEETYTLTVNPLPQQVVVLNDPSNGILETGNTGEISLSASETETVYWVTMGAAIFTGETAGNGASLSLGNNYPAGTFDVWSSNEFGCELLQGSVTFVEDNGNNKLTVNIT
ncbi:MAG: hypothetical protein U9Q98_09835, partial [Bacteroidota bacterium]|nr:hypothetical protein [Bacteroidota bacterium]